MQELDLTDIADAPEAGPAKDEVAADELDFSDISGILDEKAPVAGKESAEKPAEELDLVFDDEPQAVAAKTEETLSPEPQEDLLLDLETLLAADEEKTPEAQKTAAEMTDELDLEFAAAPAGTKPAIWKSKSSRWTKGSTARFLLPGRLPPRRLRRPPSPARPARRPCRGKQQR